MRENQNQFIATVTSPAQVDDMLLQRQAWVGTNLDARFLLLLGPSNKDASIQPQAAKDIIDGPEKVSRLVRFDYDLITKNLPGWIDRWNREFAR